MGAVRAGGIYERLAQRLDAGAGAGNAPDLWRRLATVVDPAEFRPKVAADVELKEFHLRWGNDYGMIANPRDLLHYRITPSDVELVKLMDGTRTVKEIVVEQLKGSGDLEVSGVADLVWQLRTDDFLEQAFVDVPDRVRRALHPESGASRRMRQFVRQQQLEWQSADHAVQWMYRHVLKWFFTRWAQAFTTLITVLGLVAFVAVVRSKQFNLSGQSLALGFFLLLFLNYFATFVHELGHATVLTHFGRRVKSAGFMIYFGSPAFFIDSSDGLMMERRQRIIQSAAGPYAEIILSSITASLVWLFPHSAVAPTLYKFSVLSYLVVFLNLVPLLELDGYWIFSDLIQVPDLRPMSIAFIRNDLVHKLRSRSRFSKQEVGLLVYGTLGVAFSIFVIYLSFFFWRQVFGGLVSRLWHGGPVARLILVVLALVVTGPIVRGVINLVRGMARRARALGRRLRFRLERSWRVEAAELIDGLSLFDDVPEDVLSDLAGRVRLRTVARGQPVVRQGERSNAFFVVRRGTLQVVEEDPLSGDERALRTLGRGEGFGEVGLAEASPRSATVRALEEAEVFEIDKGTFDRLLADMVHVPDFAPSLQAVGELRELTCFAHLEPDELRELLDRGEWVVFAPGQEIITQGDYGGSFYAIRSGQVEVIEDGRPVRTMGPGSHFGEIALLLDVPRTATVVARTPVRAYRLDREGFDRLVGDAFRKGTLNPAISPDRTWQH